MGAAQASSPESLGWSLIGKGSRRRVNGEGQRWVDEDGEFARLQVEKKGPQKLVNLCEKLVCGDIYIYIRGV